MPRPIDIIEAYLQENNISNIKTDDLRYLKQPYYYNWPGHPNALIINLPTIILTFEGNQLEIDHKSTLIQALTGRGRRHRCSCGVIHTTSQPIQLYDPEYLPRILQLIHKHQSPLTKARRHLNNVWTRIKKILETP